MRGSFVTDGLGKRLARIARRVVLGVAILGLLLSLALWRMSHRTSFSASYYFRDGARIGVDCQSRGEISLEWQGRIDPELLKSGEWPAPFPGPFLDTDGELSPRRRADRVPSFLGVGWYGWLGHPQPTVVILLPFWLLAVVCAAVMWATSGPLRSSVTGAVRAALRHRRGLCPACGYDLRASPECCPECGQQT
jgi:hypothetical protein